jgi:hypothetical protein
VSRAATKPQSGRSHKPSQHLDPREQLPLLQSHPRFFLPIPVFPGGVSRQVRRRSQVGLSATKSSQDAALSKANRNSVYSLPFWKKSRSPSRPASRSRRPRSIAWSVRASPRILPTASNPHTTSRRACAGMADSTPTESTKISPQFNKSWTAVLAALLLAFVALGAFGGHRWARSSEETVSIHAEIPPRQVFHGHYRRFWRHARPFATGRQDRLRCSFW